MHADGKFPTQRVPRHKHNPKGITDAHGNPKGLLVSAYPKLTEFTVRGGEPDVTHRTFWPESTGVSISLKAVLMLMVVYPALLVDTLTQETT